MSELERYRSGQRMAQELFEVLPNELNQRLAVVRYGYGPVIQVCIYEPGRVRFEYQIIEIDVMNWLTEATIAYICLMAH